MSSEAKYARNNGPHVEGLFDEAHKTVEPEKAEECKPRGALLKAAVGEAGLPKLWTESTAAEALEDLQEWAAPDRLPDWEEVRSQALDDVLEVDLIDGGGVTVARYVSEHSQGWSRWKYPAGLVWP